MAHLKPWVFVYILALPVIHMAKPRNRDCSLFKEHIHRRGGGSATETDLSPLDPHKYWRFDARFLRLRLR
jgi:hypothetical protein